MFFDMTGKEEKMKIEPCPYCASPAGINRGISVHDVGCSDVMGCGYRGPQRSTQAAAIEAHNGLARRWPGSNWRLKRPWRSDGD